MNIFWIGFLLAAPFGLLIGIALGEAVKKKLGWKK